MRKTKNQLIIVFIFHSEIVGYLYTHNYIKEIFRINYKNSNFNTQKEIIISKIKSLYKIQFKIVLYPSQDIKYTITKKFVNFQSNGILEEHYDIIEDNRLSRITLSIEYFVHYIKNAIHDQFAGFITNISLNDIFIKKFISNTKLNKTTYKIEDYNIIFTINACQSLTVSIYHANICIKNYYIKIDNLSSPRIIAGYIEQEIEKILENIAIYNTYKIYIFSNEMVSQYFRNKNNQSSKNIIECTHNYILELYNIKQLHNNIVEDASYKKQKSLCNLEERDIAIIISKHIKPIYTKRDNKIRSLNRNKSLIEMFFVSSVTLIFILLSIKFHSLFEEHTQNNEYKHQIIRFDLPIITRQLENKFLNRSIQNTQHNHKICYALEYIKHLGKYNFSQLKWNITNTNYEIINIEIINENKYSIEQISKDLKELFSVNQIAVRKIDNKILITISF